jgi:hypothetical protein
MSSVIVSGDTSGSITLSAPSVAGTNTLTLPAATATVSANVLMTAQASTSGTSITFTGIPSWAKRITVMFNGVSLSGTASYLVQVGSGSVTTTGYVAGSGVIAAGGAGAGSFTTGFGIQIGVAAALMSGIMSINLITGTTYISSFSAGTNNTNFGLVGGGTVTLSGVLDRVVITTTNGTDTFDAGSINVLYE